MVKKHNTNSVDSLEVRFSREGSFKAALLRFTGLLNGTFFKALVN